MNKKWDLHCALVQNMPCRAFPSFSSLLIPPHILGSPTMDSVGGVPWKWTLRCLVVATDRKHREQSAKIASHGINLQVSLISIEKDWGRRGVA